MAWVFLIIAGLFEMTGVLLINKFNEQKNIKNILLLIIGFGLSFFFLNRAMSTISMGTAYAIWTGIGASGSAILGMVLYGEARDWRRMACLALIICSAIGLKVIS